MKIERKKNGKKILFDFSNVKLYAWKSFDRILEKRKKIYISIRDFIIEKNAFDIPGARKRLNENSIFPVAHKNRRRSGRLGKGNRKEMKTDTNFFYETYIRSHTDPRTQTSFN